MIAILLPDKSQNSVKNAFDELYEVFGHDRFKKLFGVILTDRGTEFSNPFMFEQDINGMIELCYIIVILIVHIRKV